jgi:hypothetical protein
MGPAADGTERKGTAMLVVLRPGALARVVGTTAVTAGVLALLLGNGLAPGPAGPPAETAPAADSTLVAPVTTPYVVVGTSERGLNVRTCAAATCRRAGWVGEGGTFLAECWTRGAPASGDDRWLHGTANGRTGYAAAHFLRGNGAPECGADPARQT